MKKLFILFNIFLCLGIRLVEAQYNVLLSFNNTSNPQGNFPLGNLTVSGNTMYGVTPIGGASKNGCVFSLSTNGSNYKDLFDFNDTDGSYPEGTLTLSGNILYGTTYRGGISDSGVIFSIHTDGTGYKILTQFSAINADNPYGKLVLSGNKLFGKAQYGGANHWGCVFSVDTTGTGFKDLFDFLYHEDPWPVIGSLTISGSTLYGMTFYGGTLHYGNIFSIDTNGTGYADIYDFNEGYGDAYPFGSLTLSGNTLYGMTNDSYCSYIFGNIFSIKTDGSAYKNIHSFTSAEGEWPTGDVTLLGGKLYGMIQNGGSDGKGCIISIDTNGSGYTQLVNFNGSNGQFPQGSMVFYNNVFYGMVSEGGANGDGLIFSLDTTFINGINTVKNVFGNITISPNPSTGIFTIQSSVVSGQSSVEVYNVLGEKVYSSSHSLSTNHYSFDLSNQPNGIYLYRVLNEDGSLLGEGKVIVQK